MLGDLGTAQDEADLRAVAVRDDEAPALLDQIDEVDRRSHHGVELLRDGVVLRVGDERVAAEGDDSGTGHEALPGSEDRVLARAARASLKHAIGAVVMPAPIWPTPALR